MKYFSVVFGWFSHALNFQGLKLLWSLRKSVYCRMQDFTQKFLTILENHVPSDELTWGIQITYGQQLIKTVFVVAVFTLPYVEGRPIKTSLFFPYIIKSFSFISSLEYNYGIIFFSDYVNGYVLFVDGRSERKILF